MITKKLMKLKVPVLLLRSKKAFTIQPSINDIPTAGKMNAEERIARLPQESAVIGTVAMISQTFPLGILTDTLTWFDETASIEASSVRHWMPTRTRTFGDIHQIGTFNGKTSFATWIQQETQAITIELQFTYRLSHESIGPVRRFYPKLVSKQPEQGVIAGNVRLRGCILVNFRSDTTQVGESRRAPQERALAQRIASNFILHGISIIVASPYAAQLPEPGAGGDAIRVQTINAIQGLESEIAIISLTNRAVNEFVTRPERLVVAVTRATKLTIIIGDKNKLNKRIPWFRNSDIWCPFELENVLTSNPLRLF